MEQERNYLNPHNMPSSRIDVAPGFDSVRTGQRKAYSMTNAEAINILERIETDIYGRIAIGKAIDALKGPWVKTADRLPTEAELLCHEATPNPVRYYTDGQPYVPVGGLEIVNHPLVDKLAEYDRHEKYVLPRLLAQVKALGVVE